MSNGFYGYLVIWPASLDGALVTNSSEARTLIGMAGLVCKTLIQGLTAFFVNLSMSGKGYR